MHTKSIFLSCALLSAGTIHAQVAIPPAFVGLEDFGEVPYAGGALSFGPNGLIDSPLEDADTRAFNAAFWQVVDNGGTDLTPVTNFVWTAPTIVDMFSSEPGADPDPWFGGLTLFEYIYGHRLGLFGGPQSIEELIESDPSIALTWRHWTVYHQLATTNSIDSEAHFRHAELVLDTLTPAASTTMRGVPFYNGPILISDRLEITDMSTWFFSDPGPNPPPAPLLLTTGTQRVLDQSKTKLAMIQGLYKEDGSAFFGYGTSGFRLRRLRRRDGRSGREAGFDRHGEHCSLHMEEEFLGWREVQECAQDHTDHLGQRVLAVRSSDGGAHRPIQRRDPDGRRPAPRSLRPDPGNRTHRTRPTRPR